MKIFKTIVLFFLSTLLLTSCATVFYGSKQKIHVNSNPVGAAIYVNGVNTGKTTPADIKITRRIETTSTSTKQKQIYLLKKDGYKDYTQIDGSSFNTDAFIGSLLFGTIISLGTDAISGSNRSYPKQVNVILTKGSNSPESIIKNNTTERQTTTTKNEMPIIDPVKQAQIEKRSKQSVNEIITELNASLQKALKDENYDVAEKLKNEIAKLESNKSKIEALEKEKEGYLLREDFDRVLEVEKQINILKN